MNMTTVKHLLANHNVTTHHDMSRDTFRRMDQTNAKLFISHNNLLNQTISVPFILQPEKNSLIVGTIQSYFA